MADANVLSTEDRVAIDRIFERLEGRTHYELLAVAPESGWEVIEQALRDLRRRMDPTRFVGVPSAEYQRRIELVHQAFDLAAEVLGDPVRRFLYDQQVRRGEGRRAETPAPLPAAAPAPVRGSAPAVPVRPPTGTHRADRSPRTGEPPSHTTPGDSPLVVPAPFRKDSPAGAGTVRAATPREPPRRPSYSPPAFDSGTRPTPTAASSPQIAASERRDLDALTAELERIAVSVQFCIAQILDPQASRVLALQAAGQALADTRATLAAIQARRDEEAGRWVEALNNWLRASRAKPDDAVLLARVAECHQRLGDARAAEEVARRALAIDPACDGARAVMSALGRR